MEDNFPINSNYNNKKSLPIFLTKKTHLKADFNSEINLNNNFSTSQFFRCTFCGKYFQQLFNLKRHISEVENNIKEKCKYCGLTFKRAKDHEKNCKFAGMKEENISVLEKDAIKKNKKINESTLSLEFDLNKSLIKFINEFKENNLFYNINDSYIFFNDYCIGEGSYGKVFFGLNIDLNQAVAVKILIDEENNDSLIIEKTVLNNIPSKAPLPKFLGKFKHNKENYLIESLIGPSLQRLYDFCENDFDLVTICNIGIDILICLEYLHDSNYIHNDIKLDNIGIQLKNYKNNNNINSCTLFDLGKVCKIKKYKSKINLGKSRVKGNYKYASFNSLNDGDVKAIDDLESLCFVLLNFYNKTLPWSNFPRSIGKNTKIWLKMKNQKFTIEKYCDDNFKELILIFNDIRALAFNKRPNYSEYKNLLYQTIKRNNNNKSTYKRFKWEFKFSKVIEEFKQSNNYQLLNDTINIVFRGFPEQLSYDFINQYANYA